MISEALRYFDKIYIINLDKRQDRLYKAITQFKELGIENLVERFSAICPPNGDGRLGCLLSHIEIIKMAKSLNLKNVLVLEDDVQFINTDSITEAINQLRNKNWGLFYFGYNSHKPLQKVDKNLLKIERCYAAHAVAYNSSMFDYAIEEFNKDKIKIIDVWLSQSVQTKYECFGCYPITAIQNPGYSDIEKVETNYDFIMTRFLENTKHL
jgi:GR25 family glycosyltransferase involved in LPS biosynthesis